MEQKEIIKIIKSKDIWQSDELIKVIKAQDKKTIKIEFCHIGGYECLRDGTRTKVCKSLKDVQELLDNWDIEYNANIKDAIQLADSIESKWADKFDDGGGSGWIEY